MDKKERFTEVIQTHAGLIYKISALYGHQADREDLYQEIVFQLWKSFDTFKKQSKLSTWMYRVAMNTAIYHLKSHQKQVHTVPIDLQDERFTDMIDPSEEERIQLLYQHIQTLSLLEKGIILLYLEGKNHGEIAEIIGITVSNVGTRIARIKEKLKSQINKQP